MRPARIRRRRQSAHVAIFADICLPADAEPGAAYAGGVPRDDGGQSPCVSLAPNAWVRTRDGNARVPLARCVGAESFAYACGETTMGGPAKAEGQVTFRRSPLLLGR
jgi:hypothetical protein